MELFYLMLLGTGALALGHSYVGYPLYLWWRTRRLPPPATPPPLARDRLPRLTVLMAAHNEEAVIGRKLQGLVTQDYPSDRYRIMVGSDCSTDATNDILTRYAEEYSSLTFIPFRTRQGKPAIINQLAAAAVAEWGSGPDHLFVITDASVIPASEGLLRRMAAHFDDQPDLALVDTVILPTGLADEGISRSEQQYLSMEVRLKHWESRLWRYMIGPFGGCYALRSDFYTPVPDNFLVDDFYICMKAFERGGRAVNDPGAVCYESIPHDPWEEFRRKARISAGNFQNLKTFTHLWWPPAGLPNFAFFSHKVLRWLGPLWLLLMATGQAGLLLRGGNLFYWCLFLLWAGPLVLLPVLDLALRTLGRHWLPARHVRYFLLMNTALLAGFIRYVKGIRTNVWKPPKRH